MKGMRYPGSSKWQPDNSLVGGSGAALDAGCKWNRVVAASPSGKLKVVLDWSPTVVRGGAITCCGGAVCCRCWQCNM